MMRTFRVKVSNPHKFKKRSKKSAKRKAKNASRRRSTARKSKKKSSGKSRNPALATIGFLNPHTGRVTMKQKHKSKKGSHKHRKGSSNPFRRHGKKMFAGRRRRSSNPRLLSGGFNLLKFGAIALVGLVATRQIPQWVLGTKNQSWVGYAANALTALVLGYAAHKFVGKEAGSAVLIGGGLYTVSRMITEQVSPVGKVLS